MFFVLGILVDCAAPVRSLIFQIENEHSASRCDEWGMYLEIDEKGLYGAVSRFEWNSGLGRLDVALNPAKSGGIETLLIDIPASIAEKDRELLFRMSETFRQHPQS